ncbi:hypothetical protein [Rubrivirga sp. IMCC45206]|uniref:hypothetical protein n=1 Tax=Rubrivirga sp. IMCC45206 TaxID=3391614 RepID=UPI00398FD466
MPLRLSLLALAAVALLGACDVNEPYYEDTSLRVFVADFSFDAQDYAVGGDLKTATFDARDASVSRGDLDDALATAGDGALVMLYIDVELVSPVEGASGNPTYAALPLSRSFEEIVLADDGNGGTTTVPVVGYTASYEYSFDNQDLYFDVVSSAPYTDFSADPADLFDFIVPQRVLGGSSDIDLRLVVIPQDLYFASGRAGARIDLRDYAAVKAAYNLPD